MPLHIPRLKKNNAIWNTQRVPHGVTGEIF
nr:MAG TPA: hypothetical protein [Caudoviricetes sp.]